MKESVNAAMVQFSPKPMSQMEKNIEFIKSKIVTLSEEGHELIVFPEMSITNFFEHGPNGKILYWEHGSLSPDAPQIQDIVKVVQQQKCYVIVGFAERSQWVGRIYNSALLIGPEGIIGTTRKIHFPGLEKLYFSKGTEIPVFDTPLGKIGISICYDNFFVEYLRILAIKGAEIIAMPSSIWKGGGKGGIGSQETKKRYWNHLPVITAMEQQVYILACNGGGSHFIGESIGRWERLGLSKIVDPAGLILAEVDGNEEFVLSGKLTRKRLAEARNTYSFITDREPGKYHDLIN